MKVIVTGSRRQLHHPQALSAFLLETGFLYVPRDNFSLPQLKKAHSAEALIVWLETGPRLYFNDMEFFFHPSMGKNRISLYHQNNLKDTLIKACGLKSGDLFLDCTLGMGSDALVAAYFSKTTVTALEFSPLIASVIRWGMRLYHTEHPWLKKAIDNVEVINVDHFSYLQKAPDCSFDIIYFDPMFRSPINTSQALSPLRHLANPHPVTQAAITEAKRVARKCVVLKEQRNSGEFKRLGFNNVKGSPNNPIAYGVISVENRSEDK